MKLTTEGNTADLSGLNANAFKMEMTAKVYSMLTERLYKDKPGAVIRELSCNAYDSHVSAGKANVPFEINLPTWLDKSFSIRDYGTGIPHDKFEEVYTNIGASTKENSNDFVGAMGLGSKSPFTLADTFIVENTNGGQKSTWICFKSNGLPQVTQASIESTTEPTGLKVSFTFESDSVRGFHDSITKQLSFFPVKPIITGGNQSNWKWPEIPKHTGNYFYYKSPHWTSAGVVKMGPVAYPFSTDDLGIGWGDNRRILFDSPLCIVADLGDVDVPPSRESLEFTDKTKAYIFSVLDSIRSDYTLKFAKELVGKQTLKEAWLYTQDANMRLLDYKGDDELSLANGVMVPWSSLVQTKYQVPEYIMLQGTGGLKSRFAVPHNSGLDRRSLESPDTVFYVDDLGTKGKQHITDSYNAGKFTSGLRGIFIFKTGLETREKPPEHLKAAQEVIKVLWDNHRITVTKLSDAIGFPPPTIRVKGKPKTVTDQVFPVLRTSHHRGRLLEFKGTSVNSVPTDGYFIQIHGSAPVDDTGFGMYNKIATMAAYCKIKNIPLYFIRTKTADSMDQKKCKPYTLLLPLVVEYIKKQQEDQDKLRCLMEVFPKDLMDSLTLLPVLASGNKGFQILARYRRLLDKVTIDLPLGLRSPMINSVYTPAPVPKTPVNPVINKLTILSKELHREFKEVIELIDNGHYYRTEKESFLRSLNTLIENQK